MDVHIISILSKAQPTHFELPCTDVFMKIQPFVSSFWQERWDKEGGNKLHAIMPQIDVKYYSGCTNKKDEQSGRPPKIVALFCY